MGNPVYTTVPAEQGADPISELALDLRWTWNHATDDVWRELEPELWADTRNPWLVLQSVSHERLNRLLAEPRFQARLTRLLEDKRKLEASEAWFQQAHPDSPLKAVAYFSMEYMLSEALPIYSGGLGNVAGDQLKAASDLGVPVIAIGLLYQQGYFRQEIDAKGEQIARYPFNDPGQLPIRPLRNATGDWLRLKVLLPGYALWIRAWEAQVGRCKLYLLDTNDPANYPAYRTIAGELYGGAPEMRLRQECVLGIGGWRLLRALGIDAAVCHLNEGHCAFAVLERARSFMQDHGQPFEAALAVTRAGNLFTTHTPVEAGFDRFSPELMERYFKLYAEERLGIPFRDLMALGRANPDDAAEPFNMAYLAIRGSGAVTAVSELHSRVSRRLFQRLFPRWPEAEVPIGYVTNGVHVPTWDSACADALWEKVCGGNRWRGPLEGTGDCIRKLKDQEIWSVRNEARRALVAFTRKRLALQLANQGAPLKEIEHVNRVFDKNWLTLGFARRFATYKRPNMLLHDPERLVRILTDPARPAQIVIAGKAHPQDRAGQAMIEQWNQFIRRPEVRGHVVFLADYDMLLTQELVAGVDLWVNTPRRPWEASGTSGMKVLANGGLNVSELDGWWAEAFAPEVGWALGDGQEHGDDPGWDAAEADALYSLLERQILPAYYNRDSNGIPREWVARIRESMARLTPFFSSNRTVRQYTEEHYIPRALAYQARTSDGAKSGVDLLAWEREISAHWHNLRFETVSVSGQDGTYFYRVEIALGPINPAEVQVELYADPRGLEAPFRAPMRLDGPVSNRSGVYLYSATAPAGRPASEYTPRAIPRQISALVPLEVPLIAWQK